MIRRPPRSTRTDTLFPYPTLVRSRLLHALPFETVAGRLPAGFDPALWEAVRPNLTRLAEAEGWLAICRGPVVPVIADAGFRSEEHTSELQSLMRISYAVFCLKKKK